MNQNKSITTKTVQPFLNTILHAVELCSQLLSFTSVVTATLFLLCADNLQGQQTHNLLIDNKSENTVSNPNVVLDAEENLVYGKIGLHHNGDVRYTFAMTRKPNATKQIFKREMDIPYGPQPLIRGGQMKPEPNPAPYDLYDYFVVLNGQKMGPYDRIYDVLQEEGDVDKWITPDGKHISFAGVKGQKYYPVFGNREIGITFWSVLQAPSYDPLSGNVTFAMAWSANEARLIEKGSVKLTGWKAIDKIQYASNNEDLLFVGGKENKSNLSVYLNHTPIGGPHNLVRQIGFLPETNKPYYLASNSIIEDNTSKWKTTILLDERKFEFSTEEQIGTLNFSKPYVAFTVTTKNSQYNGNDEYKKNIVEIWEYNYETNELQKYAGFAKSANMVMAGQKIYYLTYDTEANLLVLKRGGEEQLKVLKSEMGNRHPAIKISPNGDVYTYHSDGYGKPIRFKKNGKDLQFQGIDKIMGVEHFGFNSQTGDLNLVFCRDQPVGSVDRFVINADAQFNIKGRALGNKMFFAEDGTNVISLIEFKQNNEREFTTQIYKNGELVSDLLLRSVEEFCISSDGNRYAALVTEVTEPEIVRQYFTENKYMHVPRKLMVDGKIVPGIYGAPVWSAKSNKFLVLKQEDGRVKLVEL